MRTITLASTPESPSTITTTTTSKKKAKSNKRPRQQDDEDQNRKRKKRTKFYFSNGEHEYKQGKFPTLVHSMTHPNCVYTLRVDHVKHEFAAILDRIPFHTVTQPSIVIELVTCSTLQRVCKRDLRKSLPTTLPWIDGLTHLSLHTAAAQSTITFCFPTCYETCRFGQALRLQLVACLPTGTKEVLFLSKPLEIGVQRLLESEIDLSHAIVPPCDYACMFEVCNCCL